MALLRHGVPPLVLLIVSISPSKARAQVRPDQAALAAAIANGSYDERMDALAKLRRIPPGERGPAVRSALVQELRRQAKDLEDRRRARIAGHPMPPVADEGESLFEELELVTQHRDPTLIPAVVPHLETGNRVAMWLAWFGEPAVPYVLEVAASNDPGHEAEVYSALETLRFMVEGVGRNPITPTTRAEIASLALERLTGRQYFGILWGAIDLGGVMLDRPEIRDVFKSLSSDTDAIKARGISDPDLIEKTRQRAADRLAGIPPLPRWQDPFRR